jgi:hypothetical protein
MSTPNDAVEMSNLALDCDAPEAARQRRVLQTTTGIVGVSGGRNSETLEVNCLDYFFYRICDFVGEDRRTGVIYFG